VRRFKTWKRIFAFSVIAGVRATAQVTRESFKYPFQNGVANDFLLLKA
jgi:hypothetical protein